MFLYALDILAIAYFALDIFTETDYWQIKIWKSSKNGEAKKRERIKKDIETEVEKGETYSDFVRRAAEKVIGKEVRLLIWKTIWI